RRHSVSPHSPSTHILYSLSLHDALPISFVDAKEAVIILPAMTRYEQPGGGTSTSTERMVYFSPEIKGPRIKEARSEWEIYVDLAKRVRPEQSHLIDFQDADEIRKE